MSPQEREIHHAPRYATLQDYRQVVRRQRWVIVAVTLIFAAIAAGISISQKATYEAQATLAFNDVTQTLNLLGEAVPPETGSQERAAANAQLINRPQIARRAGKRLDGELTAGEIQSGVSAEVGVVSNLVLVKARASDPELAARLANAVAVEARALGTREERERLNRAIKSIARELPPGGASATPTFRQTILEQQLAQLETIKRIAEPVEIVSRAAVPGGPVSPRPVRNILLGAILGLALGLAVAFGRDSLDRRLRRVQDVHEHLELPILATVLDSALGRSGLASNGATPVTDVELEAFRVLRTNLQFLRAEKPLHTILVTSGLPEEGKSTVASSLAAAAAVVGRRTLLVECDLRRASLAGRLGIKPTPGLSEYLQGRADPSSILQPVPIVEPSGNGTGASSGGTAAEAAGSLVCIVGGVPPTHPGELLASERFRQFLEDVRDAYDLVVIDTSPLLSVADALELVPHVDAVLVCVRLSQTTRDEARATRTALEHLPKKPTGVVVTGVLPGEDGAYGYYAYGYST